MLPVSYLGGRKGISKPRWISVGLMLMGLGSLIWTMPHFFAPIYNIQQQKIGENSKNSGSSLCQPGKINFYHLVLGKHLVCCGQYYARCGHHFAWFGRHFVGYDQHLKYLRLKTSKDGLQIMLLFYIPPWTH